VRTSRLHHRRSPATGTALADLTLVEGWPAAWLTLFTQENFGTLEVRKQEILMFQEKSTRVLVEKIDDAIEQAEDLGLTFAAGILMMARLEAVQTDQLTVAGRENKELS
jgi:hypothetical protein